MGTTELAANQFRITQARDRIERSGIFNQQGAIKIHHDVGAVVRAAIQRIGGTPPEMLPPAEHIKNVAKRLQRATPKLELDERDAKGLTGSESLPEETPEQ
jgi:DNA-damage-inducible protein D